MTRKEKFTIALLSGSHLVMDSYSSFLYQLLPMLATKLHLTPAQAGLMPSTLTITSSLMQPVYGIISDRYLKRAMVVMGPLIAAVFLSMLGTATSLPMLALLVIVGGMGVGIFHPQGAAMVSHAASGKGMERHQGFVMSVFSSSGTVGYALGPLLIASVVALFGLEKSWYAATWGIAFWFVLFWFCEPLERKPRKAGAPSLAGSLRAVWAPLTLLYFAVVLRSAVAVGVHTYWPFALERMGVPDFERASVLAGFIFFGGIGGFFGGALADRLGARRVTLTAMLVASPLLIGAFSTHGTTSSLLLMAGGTLLNLPIPISVVMAQRLVPGGASTVSALMMGFAWGAGALMTPLTGILCEHVGFAHGLTILAALPLVSAALLWFFPKDGLAHRAGGKTDPTEITEYTEQPVQASI